MAYGERGTSTTCSIAGTTAAFLNISVVYNTFLTIYHVLVVVLQKKDEWIQKHVEVFFHAVPVIGSIALLVTTNVLGFIQPIYVLSGMCGPEPYPPGCTHQKGVECTAGVKANTAYIQGPLLLASFLIISVSMISIFRKVWLTERRIVRYAVQWRREEGEVGATCSSLSTLSATKTMRLTKTIGQRGLLYTGSYFLCYIFYALAYVLPMRIPATSEYRHTWFAIAFCAKLLTPLKGFCNVFIFLAPRYQELSQPGQSLAFVKRASQNLMSRHRSLNFANLNDSKSEGCRSLVPEGWMLTS